MGRALRFVLAGLAFVVLGAATTIAVAWGLALKGIDTSVAFSERRDEAVVVPFDDGGVSSVVLCRPMTASTGWRHMFLNIEPIESTGWADTHELTVMHQMGSTTYPVAGSLPDARHMPPQPANCRSEFWFGWPMPCVWAAEDSVSSGCFVTDLGWDRCIEVHTPKGAFSHPFYRSGRVTGGYAIAYALPAGVFPRAIATNTLCYASAWWVVIFGARRARREWRIRRGKCGRCAYDLRGLDAGTVCPECGNTP